ncbi:hypothetical protein BH11PSE9_BH11PSE9_26020 [soil metagenome]
MPLTTPTGSARSPACAGANLRRVYAAWVLASLTACSPTLDWRETQFEGSGIVASFPCRPDRYARAVIVAGAKAQMDMLTCAAGGATYALSFFDVADPAAVTPALADLRALAASNLGATAPQAAPLEIKGMTANEQSARLTIAGRLPDGAAVQESVAFFVKGLRIYQATAIGAKLAPEALDTFFASLKFPT